MLYDVQKLCQKDSDRQASCFVGYLMEQSFDIYKITYSTKVNEKFLCYRFRKPETYLFVERFNVLS